MNQFPQQLRPVAASIRLVVFDVDGVLTDGLLYYGPDGEALKVFHVRDGLGMRLLRDHGLLVAAISARQSPIVARRLSDLEIPYVLLGRDDKFEALNELLDEVELSPNACTYIGDDVLDLPPMRAVGLPVAVNDAHPLTKAQASWITPSCGGHGAVRDLSDAVLHAHGKGAASQPTVASGFGEYDL